MRRLLSILALISSAVVATCLIIDPYMIYPSVGSLSPNKTVDLFFHLRLHKPYAMYERRAQHLIVGSSRSARLPPAPLSTPGNSYNAALPGASLLELRRVIEHADMISPLHSVVVGLDYYMFQPHRASADPFNTDQRLLKSKPAVREQLAHRYQRLQDYWASLYSIDAITDSYTALFESESSQRKFNADGTWEARFPENMRSQRLYAMLAKQKYRDFGGAQHAPRMAELNGLLRYCEDRNIEVTLLISPMHALTMNAVKLSGAWTRYLDWQRQLVKTADLYPSTVRVAGLESNRGFVYEALDTEQPLFQDGVHYTATAGAKIMQCLVDTCGAQISIQALDTGNIENYLHHIDELMNAYPVNHQQEYQQLLRWVSNARPKPGQS